MLSILIPEGIICVESALYHYGYSDFAPRRWSIARSRLNSSSIPLHPYYIQPAFYDLGKTSSSFEHSELLIYDRERTICDCFKYRLKLDHETFNKALHAYVKDDNKNLSNLSSYAKEMHIFHKDIELMEVLLTKHSAYH